MGEGDEDAKLRGAVGSALRVAEDDRCSSIALPAISTGIFGYPARRCARISLETAVAHAEAGGELRDIRFVLFDQQTLGAFVSAAKMILRARPELRSES
jgi:O-acetyl-ADP-ribose deacetylase (regulator of RNase III)